MGPRSQHQSEERLSRFPRGRALHDPPRRRRHYQHQFPGRKNTFANGGIYCASKWGVIGLSGCMAEDLRDHGIRVSVICPGSTATEFSSRAPEDPSRALGPEDVAHAVETIVTQGSRSFISEIHVRPLRKP